MVWNLTSTGIPHFGVDPRVSDFSDPSVADVANKLASFAWRLFCLVGLLAKFLKAANYLRDRWQVIWLSWSLQVNFTPQAWLPLKPRFRCVPLFLVSRLSDISKR